MTIDIMKGIGIVLVVFGHLGSSVWPFVYLFHMALFFIICGCCLKPSVTESYANIFQKTGKSFKRLYVPYILTTLAAVMLNNFFIRVNIYTNNPEYVKTFHNPLHSFIDAGQIWRMFCELLKSSGGSELTGPNWFLVTLFWGVVLFCIIDVILRHLGRKEEDRLFYHGLLAAVSLYHIAEDNGAHFFMLRYLQAYSTIVLGLLLRSLHRRFPQLFHNLAFNIAEAVSGFILLYLAFISRTPGFASIEMGLAKIGSAPFFIFCSVSGYFLIHGLSSLVRRVPYLNSVFVLLGKHSLAIMVLHLASFKVVNIIHVMVYNEPVYYRACPFIPFHIELWRPVYLVVGLLLPLGCALLWQAAWEKTEPYIHAYEEISTIYRERGEVKCTC